MDTRIHYSPQMTYARNSLLLFWLTALTSLVLTGVGRLLACEEDFSSSYEKEETKALQGRKLGLPFFQARALFSVL